nr:hypothetical protein [Tanacetum cinerariifolium]
MKNLETQLNKQTLYEKVSKSTFRILNAQFQKFIHSEVLKNSNYDHDAREARDDFKQYTQMEAQSFKDLIIQNMDSIERCIDEKALHEQKIHHRLKRLNDKTLQIQECKVQEVKAADASSGDINSSGFVSYKGNAHSKTGNDQSSEKQSSTCGNESWNDLDADDHEDECVVLANLIRNLKLDIDENIKIQKQLRKANATFTHEMNECKYALEKSNDI